MNIFNRFLVVQIFSLKNHDFKLHFQCKSLFLPAHQSFLFVTDGWTKNDLVYQWLPDGAVQIPKNLSLPGGFKLGGFGNQYCDVVTATGELLILIAL